MDSPKILQFCHSYGMPFADVARQYAALFVGSSYEVITVFLTGPEDKCVAEQVGGTVIFLNNTSKEVRGMKRKQIKQLKALHKKYTFVFVIAHRFKPFYIASFIKGLPIIGVHHAYGDYIRWNRRRHAYRYKHRLWLLGVSNAIRDDIRNSLPKFPADKIHTLYNRIDINTVVSQLLPQGEARKALGLPETSFIFGNVGRLHPDKDQSTLLKAFARVQSTAMESASMKNTSMDKRLVIIGTGRLEQTLKQEAELLGIKEQVIFLGKVPDAAKFYQAFDCFVLSSDHEPFGMVLLEAMVAGVPVIASHCGGATEVVGDTGQLFTLRDDKQLATCMQQIYGASSESKMIMAEKMLTRVEQYFSDEAIRRAFWHLPFIKDIAESYGCI